MVTVEHFLAPSSQSGRQAVEVWNAWEREMAFATGWRFASAPRESFETIIRWSSVDLQLRGSHDVTASDRMTAIEHLFIVCNGKKDFEDRINDRARWFRVGVRMERGRFIPITSEHLHQEIVQPTLVLLSDERFAKVDAAYRDAFSQLLTNSPATAITLATTAVHEMLRVLLNVEGGKLDDLTKKARSQNLIPAVTAQIIPKLDSLRPDSSAHSIGTDEIELGMLALHLTGSILLYLGSRPSPP